jgi:hypothetical protein
MGGPFLKPDDAIDRYTALSFERNSPKEEKQDSREIQPTQILQHL